MIELNFTKCIPKIFSSLTIRMLLHKSLSSLAVRKPFFGKLCFEAIL